MGRVYRGVKLGSLAAVAYSLYITAAYILTSGNILGRGGLRLSQVIALYLIGGAAGGVLYGAVAPLTKWRIGAVVVGTTVSIPIFAGVALAHADSLLSGQTWRVILACAALVGGVAWGILWEPEEQRGP